MNYSSARTVLRVDIDVAGIGAPQQMRMSTRKDA
jgi:hypothetical protein